MYEEVANLKGVAHEWWYHELVTQEHNLITMYKEFCNQLIDRCERRDLEENFRELVYLWHNWFRTTDSQLLAKGSHATRKGCGGLVRGWFGCPPCAICSKECRVLREHLLHEFRDLKVKPKARNEWRPAHNQPHRDLLHLFEKLIFPSFDVSNKASAKAWIQKLNTYFSLSPMHEELALKWSFAWKEWCMSGGIMG